MPAPTTTCTFCGVTTTKRQTLSLKELGGGDGRACRNHPEVVKLVEDAQRAKHDAVTWKKAMDNLRHMMLVEQIRFLMTERPEYPHLLVNVMHYRMERMGIPRPERDLIIHEAQEKGPWSDEEMMMAAFSAVEIMKRRKEWDEGKATL